MTSLRNRLGVLAAAATVLALALTGCGPGGSGEPSAEATPLPDDQQNLTFVSGYDVPHLDSTKSQLAIGIHQVMSNVMQALVKLDENNEVVPSLATSWTWLDPTTLQFTLREGVTFSDGTPFTAEDVKGSLDRYIAAKQALAASFSIISSYTADDPHTFTIHTKAPSGTLVGILSLVYIGQGAHATDDEWWSKPIGTGPFAITDYVANDHVTLTRNDSYWGEKAKLKTVTFKLITDVNAKITALSNGGAQVVNNVPYDQISTVESIDGVALTQTKSLNYYFLWFENSVTPLDDVRVRTAMWQALDLPTITSSLFGDTVSTMDSFCSAAAFGCEPADGLPTYDPDSARKLLAQAGYPDGFTVDVIFQAANPMLNTLITAFVSAWKEIGVTVTPRGEDYATWLADLNAHNWDMDVQYNTTTGGDADFTLNRLYQCAANRLGYCNPDLDALFTKAQQSTDRAERQGLYQQAVNLMAKDVPAIPLFEVEANVAAWSNVRGLVVPQNEFIDWSTVYLTD